MSRTDRRSELREAAFLILFRLDFYDKDEIREQAYDFFEGEDSFTDDERQAVFTKVMNVAMKAEEIDRAIETISVGWKTRRMTKVDLTVLRLAYYEIKYDDKVPAGSAINEAVELAKNYGTEQSGSFVNGILAKVARESSNQTDGN